MTFDTAEVLWTLNLLKPEILPNAAAEWLVEGFDSESLVLLAGLTFAELDQARILFERALRELGRPAMSRKDAILRYTRLVSIEILRGEIAPYDGAKKIWHATIGLDSPLHEVDTFIYAASEYEDRFEDQDFFALEIIKEARRWISETKQPPA